MGWLSIIFKPQKAEGTPEVQQNQETSIDNLILLLERKILEKNSAFEGDLKSYHRKMTDLMREFSKALSELLAAPGPKKIDPALMKVARSYSSSMDKAFNAARTEFEKSVSYTLEDFGNYFRKCASLESRAELDVAKYIAPLKEVFPGEMRNILKKSEHMSGAIEEIRSKLEKKLQEVKPLSDALRMSKDLKSHAEKTNEVGLQVAGAKSDLAVLESKKSELEQSVAEFLRGEKWAEHQTKLAQLSTLEKKRDEIRNFVVQAIVPIDRAMKKLKKIRADLGKKMENEGLFDLYITDPLEAFLQDADQKVLNTTVMQIKDIFEKISPDPSNKKDQKVVDSISFLESGEVMKKARKDHDEVEETIGELRAEIGVLGAKESKDRLDEELRIIANKIPEAKANLENLEYLYSKMSEKRSEMFEGVKSAAGRVLGEEIRIQPLN